jgi:hypothetical protein
VTVAVLPVAEPLALFDGEEIERVGGDAEDTDAEESDTAT